MENSQLENHCLCFSFPALGDFPFVQLFAVIKTHSHMVPSLFTQLCPFFGLCFCAKFSQGHRGPREGFGARGEDYQILFILTEITAVLSGLVLWNPEQDELKRWIFTGCLLGGAELCERKIQLFLAVTKSQNG